MNVQSFKSVGAFFALVLIVIAGCETGPAIDSATLTLREKYVLKTEPADAVSVGEATTEVGEHPNVVVTGLINGTFETGKASFMISELPKPGEGHSHAPGEEDNCPFCKRRAERAPKAIVQLVNDKQEVLPVDSRELLDVAKGQIVTVQGEGKLNSLDVLVITASGVYIEPKQVAAAR